MAEATGVAIATMIDKVSFISKFPTLSQATSDDDKPTPGYLYQEINNISLESGAFCQGLLEYLTKALRNDSCHVKLKTLRIMKYIVINGHPEFRQGLRQNAHCVQQAGGYSGPPDPLHGMAPYMMVRKEAQELAQLLFDVSQDDAIVPEQKVTKLQNIGGMGNTTSGKMQGFGNQPVKSKTIGESFLDSIVEIADKVLDPNPPVVPNFSSDRRFGDYKPVTVPDAELLPSRKMSQSQTLNPMSMITSTSLTQSLMMQSSLRKSRGHVKGLPGGGWADEDGEDLGSTHFDDSIADEEDTSLTDRLDNIKVEEWLEERELVSGYVVNCSEELPTLKDISTTTNRCSILNFEKIVEIIGEHLELDNTTESQQLGLLLVVESLLRGDTVPIDFIASTLHRVLKHLFSTKTGPVHQKTRKVIRILEGLSSKGYLFKDTRFALNPLEPNTTSIDFKAAASRSLLEGQSPEELQLLKVPFANQSSSDFSNVTSSETASRSTFSFLNS